MRISKFSLVVFSLVILSCSKEIEIYVPEKKPSLVVHSFLTPFTIPVVPNLVVDLQSSTHIFDTTKKNVINDAVVVFYRNDSIIDTLIFSEETKNYAISNSIADYPNIGDECSLLISRDGYQSITSVTTIPPKVTIEESSVIPVAFLDEDDSPYSEVTVNFNDPIEETNYYEIAISDITQEDDSYYELSTNNGIITSESYYPSLFEFDKNKPKSLLFSDNRINGKNVNINVFYYPPSAISEVSWILFHYITVHLRNVTQEYYKNKTSEMQHLNALQENILYGSGEAIDVYTNISGGFGVFAGYNTSIFSHKIDSTIVE